MRRSFLWRKTILDRAGLQNIALNINSIGCPVCRAEYHKALKAYFEPEKRGTLRNLPDTSGKEPHADSGLQEPDLCRNRQRCSGHSGLSLRRLPHTPLEKLQEYLKALHIDYSINPKIVRGLDYYTKTVFEFITTDIGAQGTVCGGGRYDGLIEQMGGKPTPAMGFCHGSGTAHHDNGTAGLCLLRNPRAAISTLPPWTKVLCLQQCSWDNSFGFPATRWNMM